VSNKRSSDENIAAAALGCWFIWVLLILAFWGGVIYIALHFLFKVW